MTNTQENKKCGKCEMLRELAPCDECYYGHQQNQEKVTKFELSDGNELRIFGDASWQVMVRQPEKQEKECFENCPCLKCIRIRNGRENQESWEKKLRAIIATPWFRYAEANKVTDAELEKMRGIIDLHTIQVADFIANLLSNQKSSLVELAKVKINEARKQEDGSLTDEMGVNRDYLTHGWNLGLGKALEILDLLKRY